MYDYDYTMKSYEAVVVGLGAMGSAAVYQLAKKDRRVLGVDQYNPPHGFGSSHGETRITRQAIAEGREYVPLVLRANEIWKQIEQETGRELFTQTGILIMASNAMDKPNKFVDNTIAAANAYGIAHSELSAQDIADRFPQFNLKGDEKGYFEDGAGFLRAEECISAQLELAKKYGAELHTNEKFIEYRQTDDGVLVKTSQGHYKASKLIFTAGPWVREVLPQQCENTVQIYRQVLYWFEIATNAGRYEVGNFPVFNWEFNTAHEDFIYGFPSLDGKSIKIATEQYAATTSPETVSRSVDEQEIQAMYRQYVEPYLPDISAKCLRAETCLYSLAPDWKFIIDYHPENRNIIIASPCSGHGFKHSAAIGEILADMATDTVPGIDITSFSLKC